MSTSSNGKGGGKQFFKKKMPKKHPPQKQKAYEVTCFAVHSKMAQSTNAKSKPIEGLYTDTDPDNISEIITDVTIRVPGKPGTMMIEVKVDPGAQPSCIPLHKFQTLFPHLCRDGLPRPDLLDNTQSEFQSYNGEDMRCYGYLLIDVKDNVTKKYHPIRFYMMNTDVPRILISHAASYWLGLVKVLCDNKAPQIKRQVASIDKKSDFRAKDGPKRTSMHCLGNSSKKGESPSKIVTSGKVPVKSPRMHNFEDAKIQGKMKCIQTSESYNHHPVTLILPVCRMYPRPPLVSLLCLCAVPHLAAHTQRAPVQVAPIVLRLRLHLRLHLKAALSLHQMLQAQRQQHQPVLPDRCHQNC